VDDWDLGGFSTYPTANPDVTITTLPNPSGRMANFSLQKTILDCADVYLILIQTCGWASATERWINTLSSKNVPVVVCIERTDEERAIQEYKKETVKNLMRLYKVQNNVSGMKNTENSIVNKEYRSLYNYVRPYPVQDYDQLVTSIKTAFGESTSIYDLDTTGLPHWSQEPKNPQKSLAPLQELFKLVVEEAAKLQKERGVNETVGLNKKKNQQINPNYGWRGFHEEEEQIAPVKKSRSSFFSGVTKLLSFMGGSKSTAIKNN